MPAEQDYEAYAVEDPENHSPDFNALVPEIRKLEAELLAAQEREKALREAVQDALGRHQVTHIHAALREALACSPSEKPGSEQKQKTLSTSDYTTTMATGAGVREDLSEKPGKDAEGAKP